MSSDVVIVGAGPAGLAAAISAAHGASVTVLERMSRPGLKLLASGGGRCNVTNTLGIKEFVKAFGKRGGFIRPALKAIDPAGLREMLQNLGVRTFSPDGVHVYPVSQRSSDVLNALLDECRTRRVRFMFNSAAKAPKVSHGKVVGLETSEGTITSTRVILCCGGRGYPALGGSDIGYKLARQCGHKIVLPTWALVPLVTKERWPGGCAGISMDDVQVRIHVPGLRASEQGSVLFTHRGISGPAVLNISSEVGRILGEGAKAVELTLAMTGIDEREWLSRLDLARREHGRRSVASYLADFIPSRLARALCEAAGTECGVACAHVSSADARKLARILGRTTLTITATEGWSAAMVTRGGVDLSEVDPRTLASRLTDGLYFAGEILDLDGPSGGFNLQWAFSSGLLAGQMAKG